MVKREQIELLRRLPKDFTTEFETEVESFKIKDSQDNIINPATKENQETMIANQQTMISKLDGILSKDSFKVKDSSDTIINPATKENQETMISQS